jgi:flagellar hook-basal body complex protein FliE
MAMITQAQLSQVFPGKFPALEISGSTVSNPTGETSFSDLLKQAIGQVGDLAAQSDQLSIDTALGKPVELHQVMLAATKAQLAMELLIEVRSRLIDAYQEISRMAVY